MNFDIQPILENKDLMLRPLQEKDFDDLFGIASDPKIWEQHPNKNRWKKEVFRIFFDGAIQSKGAFLIVHKATGKIADCTRFYDYDEQEESILIGYTFYGTEFWGKGINLSVKEMMLNYIFQYVSKVYFHVGANNIRSQIAVSRLGAIKVKEQEVTYFGEEPKLNFVYVIEK